MPALGVMVPQLPDLLDDAQDGPALLGGVLDRWTVLGGHFTRLAPHFPRIQRFTSRFLACVDTVDESGTSKVHALLDGGNGTPDSRDAATASGTESLASSLLKRSVSARLLPNWRRRWVQLSQSGVISWHLQSEGCKANSEAAGKLPLTATSSVERIDDPQHLFLHVHTSGLTLRLQMGDEGELERCVPFSALILNSAV